VASAERARDASGGYPRRRLIRLCVEAPLRRPLLTLAPAALGLLVGLALGVTLPPSFRSTVRLRAEWDRTGSGAPGMRLPDEAFRKLQQVRLRLASPAAITQATGGVRSDPSGTHQVAASPEAARAVRAAIDVRPGDDGSYLVDCVDKNAARSALVVNQLTTMLVAEVERETAASQAAAEGLRVRLLEARRELEEKQVALLGLRQQEMSTAPGRSPVIASSPGPLEEETRRVSAELSAARARAELLRQATEATTAVAPPEATGPSAELARLRTNREALRKRYTDAHPDVEAIDRRIRKLEALQPQPPSAAAPASISALPPGASTLAEVEASIRALEEREALLEAESAKVSGRRHLTEGVMDGRSELLSDVQHAQDAYQKVLAERRASETASLVRGSVLTRLQVLEPARTPQRPFFPDRPLLAAAGVCVGLTLGLVAALVFELRDRTVKGEEDLRGLLGAPLLATLPLVSSPWLRSRSSGPRRSAPGRSSTDSR
jgi:polysaccharide biosynthesis transport protein